MTAPFGSASPGDLRERAKAVWAAYSKACDDLDAAKKRRDHKAARNFDAIADAKPAEFKRLNADADRRERIARELA